MPLSNVTAEQIARQKTKPELGEQKWAEEYVSLMVGVKDLVL